MFCVDNLHVIKEKFNEYLVRLEILFGSCYDETSREWLQNYLPEIEEFRQQVETLIYPELIDALPKQRKQTFGKGDELNEINGSEDYEVCYIRKLLDWKMELDPSNSGKFGKSTWSDYRAKFVEEMIRFDGEFEKRDLDLKRKYEDELIALENHRKFKEQERFKLRMKLIKGELKAPNISSAISFTGE